jgi:MFS family permease
MRRTTGTIIATTFVGQVAGMAGFVSFPASQPEFQRLWTLSDSEAGFISGIYFAGYVIAVPLASGLTDRIEARRVYLMSLLFGVVGAFGFALAANGFASAALWRFLQGAAFGGSHMPGLRALSEAVPARLPSPTRGGAVHFSRCMRFPGLVQPASYRCCLGCCSMSQAAVIARWSGSLLLPARPRSIWSGRFLTS